MKRIFLCLAVTCTAFLSVSARTNSQKVSNAATVAKDDSLKTINLRDVLVFGNRAGNQTPVAQTNLDSKEIQALTVANNLPNVLWMTPSLVATSENGTGAGNTSFRIRGTDANRTNITLNGIPLNDPESQEVYWVDLPGMTSALQSIQVQRGVGTSTNGTGAFGASVNMTTKEPGTKSYLESATTVGSYNTFQQNIAYGTGIFGNGNSLDMRYSNLTTDGYIRNGWCKHQSFFATFDKRFNRANLRINYIYGSEHTGITWEGITEEQMKTDPTFNPAGEITSGLYYNNESDNYRQHHLQAFYTQELGKNLLLNAGLNYTNGFGYYEEYKQYQILSEIGVMNQPTDTTNLIRRKNMSNDFYTANVNLKYQIKGLNVQAGSMFTFYDGQHFGTLQWAEGNPDLPVGYEWVRNSAKKTDANAFIKAEYTALKGLNAYVDLQYRYVDYQLNGIDDDDMMNMNQHRSWKFFNPKAGLFYQINPDQHIFGSIAIAHREPTRADIKEVVKAQNALNTIKAEKLTDYELGYSFDNKILMASVNVYFMNYNDQLVPTGKLNEVGYKLMSNVDKSYRLGVEFTAGYRANSWLQMDATTTLSRNRIEDYTIWYDTYKTLADYNDWNMDMDPAYQLSQHYKTTKLPFSPELTAAMGITLIPAKDFKCSVTDKYVSEQYITNTQNNDLKLPAYNSANVSFAYTFNIRHFANAEIALYVNNLLSNQYSCNAWGAESHFLDGTKTMVDKGLYPVAPRNFLTKFTVRF